MVKLGALINPTGGPHCHLLHLVLQNACHLSCAVSCSSETAKRASRNDVSAQDGNTGFQDNDSLAKELAKELNADLLVLLTNVDGLLDGPPKDRSSK